MCAKILLLRIPGTCNFVAIEDNGSINSWYPGFLYVTNLIGCRNLRAREPFAHRISLSEVFDVISDASLGSEAADMILIEFIVSAILTLLKPPRKAGVMARQV